MQYTYIFSRVRITILKSTDYSKVKFPKKKRNDGNIQGSRRNKRGIKAGRNERTNYEAGSIIRTARPLIQFTK